MTILLVEPKHIGTTIKIAVNIQPLLFWIINTYIFLQTNNYTLSEWRRIRYVFHSDVINCMLCILLMVLIFYLLAILRTVFEYFSVVISSSTFNCEVVCSGSS